MKKHKYFRMKYKLHVFLIVSFFILVLLLTGIFFLKSKNLMVLGSSSSYFNTILTDKPVAYFRLDDSGNTASDDIPGGIVGSYSNFPIHNVPGALLYSGDTNTTTAFNGTSQYVDLPYSPTLSAWGSFSVEAWAYPTGGVGTNRGVLASRKWPTGYVLYAGSNNQWQFWINSSSTGMTILYGPYIQLNRWTHLLATFDRSTMTAKLYVDGILASQTSLPSYTRNPQQHEAIGQGEPDSGNFFPGRIDEVSFYDSALPTAQVKNHFDAGMGVPGSTTFSPKTPPMGEDPYNHFKVNFGETVVKAQADQMVSNGMLAAGYKYVEIDDTWQGPRVNGHITANANYPDGMKALGDYLHSKGLLFGIYTSPAATTCSGKTATGTDPAVINTDVSDFASWGVDYIKLDWCKTDDSAATIQSVTQNFLNAIKGTGRPMVLSVNAGSTSSNETIIGSLTKNTVNMWRTDGDICATWYFDTQAPNPLMQVCSPTGAKYYDNGIYDYIALNEANPQMNQFMFPGHFPDNDMLEVGNPGLNFSEAKTHFSMWTMWSSPLLAGNDLTNMSQNGYDASTIFLNKEVIAIDQDPLVLPAVQWMIVNGVHIWVKPLAGGGHAVAFVNLNDTASSASVDLSQLGLSNIMAIRDVWSHQDLPVVSIFKTTTLPAHGVQLVVIK